MKIPLNPITGSGVRVSVPSFGQPIVAPPPPTINVPQDPTGITEAIDKHNPFKGRF